MVWRERQKTMSGVEIGEERKAEGRGCAVEVMDFSWESWHGEGRPNIEHVHVCFGALLMKSASVINFVMKQQIFARFTSTRHPRKRHHNHVSQPDLPQNTSVCRNFRCQKGPARTGTLCHRKNGNRWHAQQEDRDHAGLAAVDDDAVVAEAPLRGRDGVAQR